MPLRRPEALIDERVHALRSFHESAGLERAQLDVSGGIDSAVMLALLAHALVPSKITAVHTRIDTDPSASARAHEVAESLDVRLLDLDLGPLHARLLDELRDALVPDARERTLLEERVSNDPTIVGSLRSTLRAPVGRALNRLAGNGVRHGTGNECEDRWTRFFQKGGDGEVDTNPLGMLSKGEVYQLAVALELPRSVIVAAPSPDLWGRDHVHSDEDELERYLGLDPGPHCFYSAVDPEDGSYRRVGLIERLSRFLDEPFVLGDDGGKTIGDRLFGGPGTPTEMGTLLARARESAALGTLDEGLRDALVLTAREVERRTRHKVNPACPQLGSRRELHRLGGLLDDHLPEPCSTRSA
ncbi:MAG: hypothetical protein AAF533_05285 [Acidobacteriota bacterium]